MRISQVTSSIAPCAEIEARFQLGSDNPPEVCCTLTTGSGERLYFPIDQHFIDSLGLAYKEVVQVAHDTIEANS